MAAEKEEKEEKKRVQVKRPKVSSRNPLGGLFVTARARRKGRLPVQGVKGTKK